MDLTGFERFESDGKLNSNVEPYEKEAVIYFKKDLFGREISAEKISSYLDKISNFAHQARWGYDGEEQYMKLVLNTHINDPRTLKDKNVKRIIVFE